MKKFCFVFGLLSLTASAQAPAPATPPAGAPAAAAEPRDYISAAEIAERMAKAEAAAKAGTQYNGGPLLFTAPYRANMEYRTAVGAAAVHESDAEMFVVIDGSGTLMLGGTMVNPTRNGANLSAATTQGGVAHKLVKGDMVMVPANTAHWFSQIDGRLVLMSIHLPMPAAAH